MIIYALHKGNGYLYKYDTSNENDIEMWFEGRSCGDIAKAFNMDARDVGGDYESDSVGMEVNLDYVDKAMDGARGKTNKYDVPYHCYEVFVLEKSGAITKHYIDVGCEEDWGDIQPCLPGDFGCNDWDKAIGLGNDSDGHRKIVSVRDMEDGSLWEGTGAVKCWYENRVSVLADKYSS